MFYTKTQELHRGLITHFDKDAFLLDLVHSQLSQVYQYTDPDEALEFWYKTFSSVYNKHAPSVLGTQENLHGCQRR